MTFDVRQYSFCGSPQLVSPTRTYVVAYARDNGRGHILELMTIPESHNSMSIGKGIDHNVIVNNAAFAAFWFKAIYVPYADVQNVNTVEDVAHFAFIHSAQLGVL